MVLHMQNGFCLIIIHAKLLFVRSSYPEKCSVIIEIFVIFLFREVVQLASKLFSIIAIYLFFDGLVVSIKQY